MWWAYSAPSVGIGLTDIPKYGGAADAKGNIHDRFIFGFRLYSIDTIQDFLCNLGMKPHMHLVEISIFH